MSVWYACLSVVQIVGVGVTKRLKLAFSSVGEQPSLILPESYTSIHVAT